MSQPPLRALVVDDEVVDRRMVMFALTNEGFQCDAAVDGLDALQKAKQVSYDLVITDLRMPKMHGHALALDLLHASQSPVPVIVIHTSLDDPRLTKDLLIRGVNDVVCKPTNYPVLAAKMKALAIRRRLQLAADSPRAAPLRLSAAGGGERPESELATTVGLEEFDSRLVQIAATLPVSNVARELLDRVREEASDCRTLAQIIERDAELSGELVRFANSALYNRIGRRVADVQEVVSRVGVKRIGEIAVAVSALSGLTKNAPAWFDKDLAWQRSFAAGMAANRILDRANRGLSEPGIVFSGLMYPLSRVILGMAYGDIYQKLVADCRRDKSSLRDLERQVFPRSPAASISQVLAHWDLPAEVFVPLIHADVPFASLVSLAEPVRANVKALKIAVFLGEFATGRWLPWDFIDMPKLNLFRELNIDSPETIIHAVRDDLDSVLASSESVARRVSKKVRPSEGKAARPLLYASDTGEQFDFVRQLLESMEFELWDPRSQPNTDHDLVLNQIHGGAARANTEPQRSHHRIIITESTQDAASDRETIVRLPTSYSAIRAACEQAPRDSGSASNHAAVEESEAVEV